MYAVVTLGGEGAEGLEGSPVRFPFYLESIADMNSLHADKSVRYIIAGYLKGCVVSQSGVCSQQAQSTRPTRVN